MKSCYLFTLATFLVVISQITWAASPPCNGKERWPVKTLADAAASNINQTPKGVAIGDLTTLDEHYSDSRPRKSIELQTYSVVCRIVGYKTEADGDFHIVLRDPNNLNSQENHMIAEIPDPNCPNVSRSPRVSDFQSARQQFSTFTVGGKAVRGLFKVQPGLYKIVGVGFVDKIHGQTGVAPNGVELHPVLSIEKTQ